MAKNKHQTQQSSITPVSTPSAALSDVMAQADQVISKVQTLGDAAAYAKGAQLSEVVNAFPQKMMAGFVDHQKQGGGGDSFTSFLSALNNIERQVLPAASGPSDKPVLAAASE